eukprot:723037-Prymnesium_polylepis.1
MRVGRARPHDTSPRATSPPRVCYGSTGMADAHSVCVTGLRGRRTRAGHACGDAQTTRVCVLRADGTRHADGAR